MVLPKRLATINRRVTNQITKGFATRLPGFGVIVHRGRRSGRTFRTPVNVFRIEGGYLVALTYGADTDWVKNVIAAGGCDLQSRGRLEHLQAPRIIHDPQRRRTPTGVRLVLAAIGVNDFLELSQKATPG